MGECGGIRCKTQRFAWWGEEGKGGEGRGGGTGEGGREDGHGRGATSYVPTLRFHDIPPAHGSTTLSASNLAATAATTDLLANGLGGRLQLQPATTAYLDTVVRAAHSVPGPVMGAAPVMGERKVLRHAMSYGVDALVGGCGK